MTRSAFSSFDYLAALVVLLCLFGCVTTARLYNLDTGEVLNASFENYGSGHGKITATKAGGKQLSGEYTTISDMSYGTGFGTATASGSGGTHGQAQKVFLLINRVSNLAAPPLLVTDLLLILFML